MHVCDLYVYVYVYVYVYAPLVTNLAHSGANLGQSGALDLQSPSSFFFFFSGLPVQAVNKKEPKTCPCACARAIAPQCAAATSTMKRCPKTGSAHARARFHRRTSAKEKLGKVPKKLPVRTRARDFSTARRSRGHAEKCPKSRVCARARAIWRSGANRKSTKSR